MISTELEQLLANRLEACRAKDIDGLMALYSDDIVYFDVVPPLRFVGKHDVRENFLRWFGEYDGAIGLEARDMEVVIDDDVAFSHSIVEDSGTRNNGVEGTVPVRSTVCCRRSDGRWLIVHEHISLPAGWTT